MTQVTSGKFISWINQKTQTDKKFPTKHAQIIHIPNFDLSIQLGAYKIKYRKQSTNVSQIVMFKKVSTGFDDAAARRMISERQNIIENRKRCYFFIFYISDEPVNIFRIVAEQDFKEIVIIKFDELTETKVIYFYMDLKNRKILRTEKLGLAGIAWTKKMRDHIEKNIAKKFLKEHK